MKKIEILAVGLLAVVAMSSCKSRESAYKKAYEKAQQQPQQAEPQAAETTPVAVAPVQQATTAPVASDPAVRSESVQLISGTGIKKFSVVCGSFSLKANAEGLQQTLKSKGYEAQIVYNPANKFYRVVATTSDDRQAAVQSLQQLKSGYADAWLLTPRDM